MCKRSAKAPRILRLYIKESLKIQKKYKKIGPQKKSGHDYRRVLMEKGVESG